MPRLPARALAGLAISLALVGAWIVNALAEPLDGGDRNAAVERAVHEPTPDLLRDVEHSHPVAMMLLSKRLFDAGRRDEAVFWFYLGQLRWRALLFQTPDPAGQAHFQRLFDAIGPAINPHAFRNLPAFYSMIDAVLAWDAAHHDDFVSNRTAKERSRQGLADLVRHTRANEDQIRARQAELESDTDPNDLYSGSGGALFSTPREMLTPYDAHRFDQLRTGRTTRDEAVQVLGGPEWWSTDGDGTSSFGYSYAGPALLGMTRVMQVTLSFNAQRILESIHLPSERAPEQPLGAAEPQYLRVRQVDGAPGTCRIFAHDGALAGARFFDHDRRILTWSYDGTARTWNAETGEAGVVLRHESGVLDAVMSRDETRVVTTSYDGTAEYWSVASGRPIAPAMQHGGWVESAIFSPDESVIVTLGHDHTARIWNAETGAEVRTPLQHDSVVWGGAFTADGARLVTWSRGASVWNARTGQRILQLSHGANVTVKGAAFLANESRIATWGYDDAVRIWNAATGEQLAVMESEGVIGAALSRDERRLLTWGSSQDAVKLWDLRTGQIIATFRGDQRSASGAAFFASEDRVLTFADDSTAQIWDAESGQPIGPAMRSDGNVNGAAISPDQTRILTWSRDRTARLFDVATGAQIGPSMVHGANVDHAYFSSNGERVLTTSTDHSARIWRISELARLPSGVGRDQVDWRCAPVQNPRLRVLTVYSSRGG